MQQIPDAKQSPPSSAHHKDLPRTELPALTSIRALLAWWVVAYHFLPTTPFLIGHGNAFIDKGKLAVDCFFILSGFVLCHVHPTIIGRGPKHGVASFLVSRLARIYPLHLVMLGAFALVLLAYRALHGAHQTAFANDTLPALIRQGLLLHGWLGTDMNAWNVPSWSISSEWGAYLLAPFIFLGLARLRPALLLAALAVLGAITVGLIQSGAIFDPRMSLPRVLLEFCIGAILRTRLAHGFEALRRMRTIGLIAGWLFAAAAAFSRPEGFFLPAMAWIMLLLALRTRRASGWLGRAERIAIYLGETSFAVYMCHALVLMLWGGGVAARLMQHGLVQHGLANRIGWALGLIVLIQCLASALHHAVELPAQRRIRQGFRSFLAARAYSAASAGASAGISANSSIGGQEQTRLRSP